MTSKKPTKPSKKDKLWQQKIEKKTKAEKVNLDHPNGRERFEKTLKESLRNNST